MKLIIEIPEMAYDAYKEWHKNNVATVEQSLIANGIPYEERPQGDLISREDLRKHTIWTKVNNGVELIDIEVVPLEVIDNAEAVDLKDEIAGAYNEGYACGSRENTRPQGEWITKTLSTFPQYQPDEYECSNCHKIVNHKTNFCPNCGAYMEVKNNGEQ